MSLPVVHTSKYFAGDQPYFDDRYRFVGPPVHDRVETVAFPWERLEGERVLYISLGTVFGGFAPRLYDVFFEAFKDWSGIVVLSSYGIDPTTLAAPPNFIVRAYVPQNAILRRATAAITHCGMNRLNDLLVHEVPFVSLPSGADQPDLAARAAALGATIALDADRLTAEELRLAVEDVRDDPGYRAAVRRINESFQAGGYPRAVDAIFALKAAKQVA